MRGLTEFTMVELISNQIIIGKLFKTLYKNAKNNLEGLSLQKADYVKESMDALRLIWSNFEDNHQLLNEAKLKDDKYFTTKFFKNAKIVFEFIMAVLHECRDKAAVSENSEENPASSNEIREASLLDELITEQHNNFSKLEDTIKNIDIDNINEQHDMEEWQNKLKIMWDAIEDSHKQIKIQTHHSWPDVTYHLDFIRYKNMYETTVSLFNYKIDALLFPVFRVIPHIGIPTWKMFDTPSDVHPFAVKSIAWAYFESLSDLMRNNKISEGDKRQLLIRTFLTYQMPSDSNEANRGAEENDREEDGVKKNDTPNEAMNYPTIEDID